MIVYMCMFNSQSVLVTLLYMAELDTFICISQGDKDLSTTHCQCSHLVFCDPKINIRVLLDGIFTVNKSFKLQSHQPHDLTYRNWY